MRHFLVAVASLGLTVLVGCLGPQTEQPTLKDNRSTGDANKKGSGNIEVPDWDTANLILDTTCGGSSCHSREGKANNDYVDNEDLVADRAEEVLESIEDGSMPLGGDFESDDDKELLLAYLNDLIDNGSSGDDDDDEEGNQPDVDDEGDQPDVDDEGDVPEEPVEEEDPAIALMVATCGSGSCHAGEYDSKEAFEDNSTAIQANNQRMLDNYVRNNLDDDEKDLVVAYVESL